MTSISRVQPIKYPRLFAASANKRFPLASLDELTEMLEIDLMMHQRDEFKRRIGRALASAYDQGSASSQNVDQITNPIEL